MSLFRSSLRPPAIISDEAVERYLSALRATIEPDPIFRRRLRGEVVNRYVATREGHVTARTLPRRMTRIGRAALYASFTLAVSVTSVMAASQEAIPGDVLYPLKRQVEQLRAQVVPAHLQDELAAYVLAERIQELGRLSDNGSWVAAVAMAEEVSADYRAYVANEPGQDAAALAPYVAALNGLLESLPVAGRTAVEDVLVGMPGIDQGTDGQQNGNNGNGSGNAGGPISSPPGGGGGPPDGAGNGNAGAGGGSGNGNGNQPTPTPDPAVAATPAPTPSPTAEPTPKPTKSPKPDPTPRPSPSQRAPGAPNSGD